ncbi:hypothetical protein NNC19_09570 [Clostridium sp. SHJSY1]|uniref:hypothetical protein n=1 Tax=Clostridium sp. SHJSY1 TaxID=2942483 RepID=UPI0028741222|nr:hypothetical protein [Clostridium sp. SHJSY1]MDS0525925.1 hypothetical protein [Clostridium sp. SHJSY1]
MNKKFLYKKVYTLGFIDDSEEDEMSSWFLDDSREILEKKIRQCDFHELIIELIDIFRGGSPSYSQLAILFGFESVEEISSGDITKKDFHKIQRSDIDKIEMDIKKISSDKPLILHKLYLYVNNLPSIESLTNKIDEVYKDIYYEENEGLIIHENECDIIIHESR